ncbi:hypothetical protein HJD18_12730 [Thermoleophilia bacterium SCSIO 60948]|nr:hypothetical protein HJD18_12730 [Thermoleophilia bacterium SCSIO 60948]
MAIARRLGAGYEPVFLTFSAAAPVVSGLGFPVEYIASYDRPGAGNDIAWTWRTRARVDSIVRDLQPRVVMFDGTHPYERVVPAMRASGAPLVWCRRPMWLPSSDTSPLHRTGLFDHVLEPGELAADADRGPTVARRAEAHRVGPVVLIDRSEVPSREIAAAELGLNPHRPTALVQLGQGPGVREANRRCLEHLSGRPGLQVAAFSSTLADLGEAPDGVTVLPPTYPISRFASTFDLAVVAAGYNAFHELIALGVPALYVPMPRQTDDQPRRAAWAREAGLGEACTGPDDPELEARLDGLLDRSEREAIEDRLGALPEPDGAEQAARWLEGLASGERADLASAAQDAGGGADGAEAAIEAPVPSSSSALRRRWIFASSVPRTVSRIGRQTVERPRVRTVVLAFGLATAELPHAIADALRRSGESPRRTLVITDALDFSALLAAGVGFERIPAEGEYLARASGLDWDAFCERRLGEIMARRPRPKTVLELGRVPPRAAAIVGSRRGVGARDRR